MVKFVLIFFFYFTNLTAFAQNPSTKLAVQKIIQDLASVTDFASRLEQTSALFVGKPYLFNGPLGEGSTGTYDQDPLYRLDGFDCTTFVETAIAIASARSLDEFETLQNFIRYQNGVIEYTTRNHFVEIDWNPNNIRAGFFRDVTQEIALPEQVGTVERIISKKNWYSQKQLTDVQIQGLSHDEMNEKLRSLRHAGDSFADENSKISFIKKSALLTLEKHLPELAVMNVLRDVKNGDSTIRMVTHQVLMVQKGNSRLVRQASSKASVKKVIEQTYADFVQSLLDTESVQGLNVLEVLKK